MPANGFIWDTLTFPILFLQFLECCVIIVGFLLFNLVYRNRKYLNKSFKVLISMIFYEFCMLVLGSSIWSHLNDDYNRNFDLIISYTVPFLFLGSMTTLYLGIKHNKKYFILYLYNAFFFIQVVLIAVNPSLQLFNDAVYPVIYILFLFTYLIPLLLFFMHIKEDWWNSLKRNIS